MNNINFELNKYIILYIDENNTFIEDELQKELKLKHNINIVKFLFPSEIKSLTENIIEIYNDTECIDYFFKDAICIFYFSKIKRDLRSKINKYLKYIIFEYNLENINDILNNLFNKKITEDDVINNNNIFFQEYKNFKKNSINNSLNNKKNIIINIKKNLNKINNNNNDKIHIITNYIKTDIEILNIIQKKCIIENLKNRNVIKMIIIGENLENELKEIFGNIENKNLILFNTDKTNISFKDLILVSQTIFENNKIICILRSDIIIPNQPELDNLEDEFTLNNNQIFGLSRIDRLTNGQLCRLDKNNNNLNSVEQDAWIFKSNISINLDLFENVFFYEKYSNLIFNKILIDNNFTIINNSKKFKIIRILYNDNVEIRPLIKNIEKLEKNNIYLLPDNENLEKISIENLIKMCNLNDKDLYLIKCYLFNKYFINKINF